MEESTRTLEPRVTKRPDGTEIHYTSSGSGHALTTVVLIHGWACLRSDFDEVTKLLPESVRALAVDLAEHGDSRSTREDFSIAELARDVLAVCETEDVSGVVVVGHSLGGAVAVEVARQAPTLVSQVVALDALHYTFLFGKLSQPDAEGLLTPLRDDFAGLVRSMVEAGSPEGTDEALKDAHFAKMVSVRQPAGTRAFEGLVDWDMESALVEVDQPVTVYAVEALLTEENAAYLRERGVEVVGVDLGSHHFGVENPAGTASLLAALA
ncbi:alpha/beta hydrolase [Nocardioides sp. 1609]|uniref:alpha/beta fold hydrolase n=1 Tax=Nocardioides sp. 1609 TaxID=2508327 RepID=UPI0010702AFE|nr:alpha/beta hydrolase [Nocardioides sp. 1609]